MYRLIMGQISLLSAGKRADQLYDSTSGSRPRTSWLAGRVLLQYALNQDSLPEIDYTIKGKPGFPAESGLWFNLSHSGDQIVLLLSDAGEVGCDLEIIRARPGWRRLADSLFSPAEHAEIARELPDQQLVAFWRIWTRKEAIIKQHAGSVWQMAKLDSHAVQEVFISHYALNDLILSLCTPTPCSLTVWDIERFPFCHTRQPGQKVEAHKKIRLI